MTWANTRCLALGPAGESCALPAGHVGDHSAAGVAPAAAWPPPDLGRPGVPTASHASPARLAGTALAVLLAAFLFGLLVGPMYLWLGGGAALAIVYVLAASR